MNDLLAKHRERANKYGPRYTHAVRTVRDEKKILAAAETELADTRAAQEIVQATAQRVQQAAHDRIASVVSQCLRAVFDLPYEFQIIFERKRGKTEARLVFVRGELEIDPLDSSGGGCVDIASFALRVACLILSRPPLRRVLILDEPFSHVKPPEVLAPKICEMLKMLAEQFDMQFILIPSIQEFYRIGKVIEIQ